ncbi:DUF3667 domain-containing protein [Ferruginibacter sp.]
MSHLKERKEKNCLNCNAQVYGKYCHLCGQENIEPRESLLHLVNHFFQDITHFDGKFFSTLKLLITKPGFLPREYMIGRRASYLNPIRMYIFTSAFFFLIFFSFFKVDKNTIAGDIKINGQSWAEVEKMDSLTLDTYTRNINKQDKKEPLPMTKEVVKQYFDSISHSGTITFTNTDYKSKEEYDSVLRSGKEHDGWIMRSLIYKQIEINKKFNNNPTESISAFTNILLHSLPQLFFISLPLFALLLKILYNRRKQFYYVNHGIFSVHFYIFMFITMLLTFGLAKFNSAMHWKWISILQVLLFFGAFFYLYKAMRKFYQQRRGKTILKFLILSFAFAITMLLLLTGFVFSSLFKL